MVLNKKVPVDVSLKETEKYASVCLHTMKKHFLFPTTQPD
jgi:hypothetical protein